MIVETYKAVNKLPDWCADITSEVKPPAKRFICEREPVKAAKKLEEVFSAEEISELVALLTMKY